MKDLDTVIKEALDVLKRGGLILYPTDTVWGIGCDATNEAAVQKVFALKRRAEAKSLVLLPRIAVTGSYTTYPWRNGKQRNS